MMSGMYLAATEQANKLLETDPLALLIGMLLDQQIPMEKAFTSPDVLRERLGGTLDARTIAEYDAGELETIFRTPPALHRFPAAMAKRVQALAATLVERFDGDAPRCGATRAVAPSSSAGWPRCPASASRKRRSSRHCSASSVACGRAAGGRQRVTSARTASGAVWPTSWTATRWWPSAPTSSR